MFIKDIVSELKSVLPEIELAVNNAVTSVTTSDEIKKILLKIDNTQQAKAKASNQIKQNMKLDGFNLPTNFEKNPSWYIYLKIINFVKSKWITIKPKNFDQKGAIYTNIKYSDLYDLTPVEIWSLYWSIAEQDHEYTMSLLKIFKQVYQFDKKKAELKFDLQNQKTYTKKTEFAQKHELVTQANQDHKSKSRKNSIKKFATNIEEYIYPTNFSDIPKIKNQKNLIDEELVTQHQKVPINYLNTTDDAFLENQKNISNLSKNKNFKNYQIQRKFQEDIYKAKIKYIKNIKISKLKIVELEKNIISSSQDISKLEDTKIYHQNRIQEYILKINEIDNKLSADISKLSIDIWKLSDIKNADIIKSREKTQRLNNEKLKIQNEIIPNINKKINNIDISVKDIINEIKANQEEIKSLLDYQKKLKKTQKLSKNKLVNTKISLIQTQKDIDIQKSITSILELLKYDNVFIKNNKSSYSIYIDISKKTYKNWTMYPMLYNHHKPLMISTISQEEFIAICDIYPTLKTKIQNHINKNPKNIFLNDRINTN